MKFLCFVLIFLSTNTLWADRTRSIEAVITELRVYAEGGQATYELEGYNLAELVISFALQAGDVTEDTEFIFDYKNIESTDEIIYGTTDAKNFSEILFSAIHFMDDDALAAEMMYSADERAHIESLLKELETLQPIYSWNPVGESVCGTFLTTPVIIDPQTKKAFELNFYRIEGC